MDDAVLMEAYNVAVDALRRFHEAHRRIVAFYIVNPSRPGGAPHSAARPRAEVAAAPEACAGQLSVAVGTGGVVAPGLLRGTGGTDLVRFLKGVRDRTSEAAFSADCGAP